MFKEIVSRVKNKVKSVGKKALLFIDKATERPFEDLMGITSEKKALQGEAFKNYSRDMPEMAEKYSKNMSAYEGKKKKFRDYLSK